MAQWQNVKVGLYVQDAQKDAQNEKCTETEDAIQAEMIKCAHRKALYIL